MKWCHLTTDQGILLFFKVTAEQEAFYERPEQTNEIPFKIDKFRNPWVWTGCEIGNYLKMTKETLFVTSITLSGGKDRIKETLEEH